MPPTKGQGGEEPPTPTVPVRTGGGDGDDGEGRPPEAVVQQPQGEEGEQHFIVKHRKDFVTAGDSRESQLEGYEFSFVPNSLLGSWFHAFEEGEIVWQGVIVGELGTTYLCQIDKVETGVEDAQVLIPFEHMVDVGDVGYQWRFYDTEGAAKEAYHRWVASERERK